VHVGHSAASQLADDFILADFAARRRDHGRASSAPSHLLLPNLRILPASWGGPPGPRGTPASRSRDNDTSVTPGARRPTGASAADRGVRPTISPQPLIASPPPPGGSAAPGRE